jgi:hypothetical protein
VYSRFSGMSRLAAAGAVVLLASGVAACGSSGSNSSQRAMTPLQAIQLAARTTGSVNSFVGTIDIHINTSGETGDIAGTFTEQLHPTLLASVDFSTFSIAGLTLNGGMGEIITSSTLYLRMSVLTQALHTSKPWIAVPFSALNNIGGLNLGSLLSQAQSSSPLTQSMMFAGATNVRTVGTGTLDGVPVTEYTGTISMSAALAKLPASDRAALDQEIAKAGISSAQFTAWVDGQNRVRKSVVTENGTALSETITTTITSINQPVSIQAPPASQTTSLPAGALNSLGS